MFKKMLSFFALACLTFCYAQDFGAKAAKQEIEGPAANVPAGQGESAKAIVAEQEAIVPKSDPSPEQMLRNYANKKNYKTGSYDKARDRIVVIQSISFDVRNPKVWPDFIDLKREKMKELILLAKAKIIEGIFSSMSGEQILSIPGNPIAKQVEKAYNALNKQLKQSEEDLVQLGFNLNESMKNKDSVSQGEVMAIISSWFTAKDKENYAAKLDADKKETYENAKKAYFDAVKEYEALKEQAEAIRGTISRELKSSTTSLSKMPIFGCTILQQQERIVKKNGKFTYNIAIMYCWSNEMQETAGKILKGQSVTFSPGKRSIEGWIQYMLENGKLAGMAGPRQYIDNEGNMWFLGIACASTHDDADTSQENLMLAEESAKAETMYSLFADASTSKTTETLMQARRIDSTGQNESKVMQSISATISQSYRAGISGLVQLYSDTLPCEAADGIELQVVIYGVNSGSVATLKAIQERANSLGIEVNTAQEFERGRQQQMRKAFEASKDNPQARANGAAAAANDLQRASEQRTDKDKAPKPSFTPAQNTNETKTNGTLKPGTYNLIVDEDEL